MSNHEIFICFHCGTKNRVPSHRLSGAKCGKCHKALVETRSPPTHTPESDTPRQTPAPSTSASTRPIPWRWVFIAAVFIPLGYLYVSAPSHNPARPGVSSHTEPEPPRPAVLESLPPVVDQAPGIMWNATGRPGLAPLRIITRPGADYYIKLVDYHSGADGVGIFVRGGSVLEREIPLGSYRLRYAYGKAWRGLPSLFGPGDHTGYQQSSTRFDFSSSTVPNGIQYNGHTVELIRQVNGNMPTHSIAASEF